MHLRSLHIIIAVLTLLAARTHLTAQTQTPDTHFRNINMSHGLTAYGVRHIAQDDAGFLWFGTDNGLCRYDGIRVHPFRIPEAGSNQYISALTTLHSAVVVGTNRGAFVLDLHTEQFHRLSDRICTTVNSIATDCDSNLWLATVSEGIYRMDMHTGRLKQFPCRSNSGRVDEVYVDNDNQVWALSSSGTPLIARLDKAQDSFRPVVTSTPHENMGSLHLLQTRSGDYYVGTWNKGLLRLLPEGRIEPVTTDQPGKWGTNTACLHEAPGGEILLANNEGIQAYDPSTHHFRQVSDNSTFGSTTGRFAYAVTTDNEGGIWYGTFYGGVTYISPVSRRFEAFTPSANGLRGALVENFCEDTGGRIWIATDDGGLNLYSPLLGRFLDYPARPILQHANVHGLCQRGDDLWIGTYGEGIYRMNLSTGQLSKYCGAPRMDGTSCYAFHLTASGQLWAAGLTTVYCYDEATDEFRIMKRLGSMVLRIVGDHRGNIWFATQGNGLWRYDTHRHSWHSYRQGQKNNALRSNFINTLCVTPSGRVVIGTAVGIYSYNAAQDRIDAYLLKDENVNAIIADGRTLWISTDCGLVQHTPGEPTRRYNRFDGLVSDQSLPGTGFMDSEGRIYIGAVGGFSVFSPYRIRLNRQAPRVFITHLQVNNHDVRTCTDLLPQSPIYTRRIDLDHTVNSITLSLAALSYCAPDKNAYAYMLEGFDKEWIYAGAERQATYSNLPAGTYTFRVKATNNDGFWSTNDTHLTIVVHPPFWWSLPAKLVYLALIILTIYLYTHLRLRRARLQHKREMNAERKRQQAQEREQRLRFFTLVAHEIRTPVSLIIGPLETVIEQISPSADNLGIRRNLSVIQRNAQRLLELVNQLLDFEKVQHDGMRYTFRPHALRTILVSVAERFRPTLQQRGIRLTTLYPDASLKAVVDSEAVTKVVSNLMSNAMKYTKSAVTVSCRRTDEDHVAICVSDNGQGISPEEQKKIFGAFYQTHDNKPGTGIGLSTVKSIVESHGGTVKVESEPGEGATFIVTLPVHHAITPVPTGESAVADDSIDNANAKSLTDPQPATSTDSEPAATEQTDEAFPADTPAAAANTTDDADAISSVLIVEDDADLRDFIADNIRAKYDVSTAENGEDALRIIQEKAPQLVVSDWMMPVMDGEALCRHLRENRETSHIPFIMLTAKTDDESKVRGINCGADAFIEKPFSVKYLEACINRLIETRRELMGQFARHPEVPIRSITKSELDDKFLATLRQVVEDNLNNPQLSIAWVAESMQMGRTLFFKKIKALTGGTPNELIQTIRLRKAAEMLQKGSCNTRIVSDTLGFSTPSYFNKCFAAQFGCSPKEYAKRYAFGLLDDDAPVCDEE